MPANKAALCEISIEDVRPGALFSAFEKGAVGAVIRCDGQVSRMWSKLLGDRRERLPWEAPLTAMARNYHDGGDIAGSVGDVFYFQPGQHSYIARKFEIVRSADGVAPQTVPAHFVQEDGDYRQEAETLADCCSVVDRIMLGLTPTTTAVPAYKVVVQRLKYQERFDDAERIVGLIENSLGRWSRAGFEADRVCAAGPVYPRRVSAVLGLLSLVPGIGRSVDSLGRRLAQASGAGRVDQGVRVLERPHVDMRFFTGLCGRRQGIRTEAYCDGNWVEVPVAMDGITILPACLATKAFGLKPVLHRVLQVDAAGDEADDPRTRNVTLLLGAK